MTEKGIYFFISRCESLPYTPTFSTGWHFSCYFSIFHQIFHAPEHLHAAEPKKTRHAAAYLSPCLALRYRWSVLTDQRGHCSTLKIMHPFPKSSLSQELEENGQKTKINTALNKRCPATMWHQQKEHLFLPVCGEITEKSSKCIIKLATRKRNL